jgi:hypothetical protein
MTHQFDELAKALAEDVSRREALRRIGGAVAGALLVSLGWSREAWGETRAACKSVCGGLGKHGKQCMDACLSCSSVNCMSGPAGAKTCLTCTGGKVCSSGTCQCPSGTTDCSGACVNTATDPNNCGGCGSQSSTYVCRTDQICSGQCQCPTGQTDCSGTCVNTATDPNNCGGCVGAGGTVCSGFKVCSSGSCTCPQDYPSCGGKCCQPGTTCGLSTSCSPGWACFYAGGGGYCL